MDLNISHLNFKKLRESYGIRLVDVAERSGLSQSTISAYERFTSKYTQTRARDYNEQAITKALHELINEKLGELFVKPAVNEEVEKMEEKVVTKVEPKNEINSNGIYIHLFDRETVSKKILEYLKQNNISSSEFCAMCGISNATFNDCVIKSHPTLYPSTIGKICNATGWDISKFDECYCGKDFDSWKRKCNENKEKRNRQEKKNKAEPKTIVGEGYFTKEQLKEEVVTAVENPEKDPNTLSISDYRLIFENGQYYEEYIITRRVKRPIAKEQFLSKLNNQKED